MKAGRNQLWGSLHTTWSSFSSHFQEESSNLQSSTVLKMQYSSSTNVAIDNLHSSASQIFGFFTSSFFNVGLNEQIFIFVFMLELPPSNPLENPQGAPIITCNTCSLWLKPQFYRLKWKSILASTLTDQSKFQRITLQEVVWPIFIRGQLSTYYFPFLWEKYCIYLIAHAHHR